MTQAAEDWIRRASTGDPQALEELLVRYLPELVEYIRRRSAHWLRQRESAADLAQSVCREVLERVQDGRLRFRGEPQFRQWLYRAAVIKLVERARSGGAQKRDPGLEESRAPEALESDAAQASPTHAALFQEELERFRDAFQSLGERDRQVISLKLVEGLSHREVAVRLQTSEPNSRMLLARALALLAQRGFEV